MEKNYRLSNVLPQVYLYKYMFYRTSLLSRVLVHWVSNYNAVYLKMEAFNFFVTKCTSPLSVFLTEVSTQPLNTQAMSSC